MPEPVTPEPTEGSPPSDETPSSRTGEWVARARTRATTDAQRATAWVEGTHTRKLTFDFAVELRNRDQDAFASVLGSAIALRLFLFTASLTVVLVSLLNLVLGDWGMDHALTGAGITGSMAAQVESATKASAGRDLGILLTGIFLALSSGRSLTKVLAACSAGGWRIDARKGKASVAIAVRVTGVVALLVISASGLTRLRDAFGIAVAAGSITVNIVIVGIGWFFVCLALPRTTRDPGAVIPGAVTFAIVITLVQWFMHYYLPRKIASASEVMGSMGATVASLGYLFLIGRVMAGTIVLNVVVFERFGSISELTFSLPFVRRIPARFPVVARFFDLVPDGTEAEVTAETTEAQELDPAPSEAHHEAPPL